MNNILAIARNTFREAIRNKVLYIIVVFLLVLILMAFFLGSISFDENDRVIKNFAHMAITLLGLLVAMFVGVNMICDELDRRTIYTLVANGVRRHEFILGKFLGLFYTVVMNAIAMTAILYLLLWLIPKVKPGIYLEVSPSFLQAMIMSLFEMMVVIAFAVLFSSFSTPILSAVLTLLVWIIGRGADYVLEYIRILGNLHPGPSIFREYVLPGLYYLLPNLSALNEYGKLMADKKIIPISQGMIVDAGVSVLYTAVVLCVACFFFRKRDFK